MLPRGDEYNQAVQNPLLSFADTTLKKAKVETTILGLPKPYSGGFTTTYKFANAGNHWAVRCFTREIKDLQKRYQAIGKFTQTHRCPFLVNATYLKEGIKVNGSYYPIIKMDWLEGEPLNIYIDKIQHQPAKLKNLLAEFVTLVGQLTKLGIAHGDLQHGNVMVKNGQLFLIDYDGMYFPDLAHLPANELGHPNFQHPDRQPKDYHPHMDRFSSIVIYTALKALTINPDLWHKYENGDNLLFKASDFANPQQSPLLKELQGIASLKTLANNLIAICTQEFSQIPSLDTFINTTVVSSVVSTTRTTAIRSAYKVLDGKQKGQLLEHVGQKVVVVGKIDSKKVATTKHDQPYMFLNFGYFPGNTFTIVLWNDLLKALNRRGISSASLVGKYVSITGVMNVRHNEYKGAIESRPQIALDTVSQLHILDDQEQANALLNPPIPAQPKASKTKPAKPKNTPNEIDFWDKFLKDKPVTPAPKAQPKPTYKSEPKLVKPISSRPSLPKTTPIISNNPTQQTSKQIPATKSEDDKRNYVPFTVGVIGAIIGGAAAENVFGAIAGYAIGAFIGSIIWGE